LHSIADQPFRAGQLATRADEWRQITSDQELLQHVRNHHLELSEIPVQDSVPRPYNLSENERNYARKEIDELLSKGVISIVDNVDGEYYIKYFL
jgi:hypothetical protein